MKTCVLCDREYEGYGHNAQPLDDGLCCDECNDDVVKERLRRAGEHPAQKKL